jgi:hypothetical protein
MVTRTRRRGRKDGEEKNAKAQRRKDAKKTGEPKPKKNIFTVPSYLQSRVQSWVQSSAIPFLIFFLAPLRLCAFAFFSWSSLRPCVFAPSRFLLLSIFIRWTRKKNQPSRGLGETADGCLLKDGSDRRVD